MRCGVNPKPSFISFSPFMHAGYCYLCASRGLWYQYISLRYVPDNLRIWLYFYPGCPLPLATPFPSHSCPSCGFLFLQCLIEQHTIHASDVWQNPMICSQWYALGSCSHSNIEVVSCYIQSNTAVAARSVYRTTCEQWHSLFSHVCLTFVLSFPFVTVMFSHPSYSHVLVLADLVAFFWPTRNTFFNISKLIEFWSMGNNTWVFLPVFSTVAPCPVMP